MNPSSLNLNPCMVLSQCLWIIIFFTILFLPSGVSAQFGFGSPYSIIYVHEEDCCCTQNHHFELGDFNGDGATDAAANTRQEIGGGCGYCNTAAVSVLPGWCALWPATSGGSTILISDLTNDDIPDMAIGSTDPGIYEIAIIGGDGSGFFNGPSTLVNVGFPRSWWLRDADLNHDGLMDFIAISESHTLASILLADGEGNFEPYISMNQDYFGSPRLEDINNDSHADLIYFNGNNAKIRLGTGNGTFQQPTSYSAGITGEYLRVGDINTDNFQDIIISGGNQVSVIPGPAFNTYQLYSVDLATDNALGDFDGDGTIDIAVSNPDGVAILQGNPNDPGSFFPAIYLTLSDPWDYWYDFGQIETTDLNGDGLDDIFIYGFGNYDVVAYYNTNGCVPLNFSGETIEPSCHGAATGSIDLTPPTNGTGPFEYEWSNGSTTEDITGLVAGVFTVTVTDDQACASTASFILNEPAPLEVSATAIGVTCYGGSDGEASATASGGGSGFEYEWSNGESGSVISNLGSGFYTVTVTDANGCTMSASAIVDSPASQLEVSVSGEGLTCFGSNNGMASADPSGGTPGYQYAWSNNETTQEISNLPEGLYTLTVTDQSGCTIEESIQITSPESISLFATGQHVTCFALADGSAQVTVSGGTPGYSYLWSNGATTPEISNLTAGIYSVTITDQQNCTAVTTQEIDEPELLEGLILTTDVTVYGGNDGTAQASISGGTIPYVYLWSNGQTTQAIQDLIAGIYTVTITDANECDVIFTFQINQPSCGIEVSIVVDSISCNGSGDGSATANFSGGTGEIGFLWSNGDTTQTIDNLGMGVYSVTVSGEGCSEFSIAVLTDPPQINTSVGTQPTICNDSTGIAYISAGGGTGLLNYLWSTGDNTDTIEQLVAGIYSVTVQDQNGCSVTHQAIVSAMDTVAPMLLQDTTILYLDTSGIVSDYFLLEGLFQDDCSEVSYTILDTVPLSCGPPAYDTLWVEVSDLSGNTAAYPVLISVVDTIPPEITQCPDDIIQGSCQGGVYFDLPGTTDNCAMPMIDQTAGLPPGSIFPSGMTTIEYTVTDQAGLSVLCTFTVTIEEGVVLSAQIQDARCHGIDDGVIELDVSQIAMPYTLSWSTGDTSTILSGLGAGDYSVMLTDANGCTGLDTFTVDEPEAIRLDSILTTSPSSNEAYDGAISIDVVGGTTPYAYKWYLNGEIISDTQNPTNLGPGSYILQVTDALGCVYLGLDIILSVVTGLSEASDVTFEIFPNPVNDQLYVLMSFTPEEEPAMTIYDVTGRAWKQANLTSQQNSISLEGLPQGLYVISIRSGDKFTLRKFIFKP